MFTSTKNHTEKSIDTEDVKRVYSFLKTHPVGVLAAVDPNNNPHASVIYFSVNDSLSVTFVTKRDTQKHDNLQHNNHVMLVAYEPLSQTTVQIQGAVQEITDSPEAQETFLSTVHAAIKTSTNGVPPISKLQAGHYVSYRLDPVRIRMISFGESPQASDKNFITIDFEN